MTFKFIVPAEHRGHVAGDRTREAERLRMVAKRHKADVRGLARSEGREIGRRLRDAS